MTDRELLEFAAKAVGIDYKTNNEDWKHQKHCAFWSYDDLCTCGALWNPLTDDGDALRLAVKLRIEVEPWIHGDSACARAAVREVLVDEPHYGDDPERATRRAIVRAAAEIGRRMK